ncbi:Dps family protein [Brochothrix campestris]|uniref:DNA protection during starvation protein n=1 Tax=Brochothrix campestris FSL F6-1037 TaxID=1265861 RepID=W7CT44_9LIST|nr:DNA starvation/stationary phase protection protein [Brochothrix campestris]EUJ39850.1 DNA protection during starvation protein [Brochothrix campestris FSL F6-1037]
MKTIKAVDTKQFLNHQVANYGVVYIKLHQLHWYVKGSHFFTLHEKFEELYNETTAILDEIAERLIAIGGAPYSTLAEFIAHSSIEEQPYKTPLNQDEMVKIVIADLTTLRDELVEGIAISDEENDSVTNDLLISKKASIDTHIWFYTAFLGEQPVPAKD